MIEEIKEELQRRYNKAVHYYASKEYDDFYSNIRVAIEYVSKLLIYDLLKDEEEFQGILENDQNILREYNFNRELSGKSYCYFVAKAYEKRKNSPNFSNKDLRWLRNLSSTLASNYDLASPSLHSNYRGNGSLSQPIQAARIATFFMGFFDELSIHRLMTNNTISFLLSLDKFKQDKESKQEEVDLLKAQNTEKEHSLHEAKKKISEVEDKNNSLAASYQELQAKYEALSNKYSSEIEEKNEELNLLNQQKTKIAQAKDKAEQIAFAALAENEKLKEQKAIATQNKEIPQNAVRQTVNRSSSTIEPACNSDTNSSQKNIPSKLKDPTMIIAWTLSNSKLTTKEIVDVSKWRPIDAYRRLTKLVEKGYFDSKRFIPADIYNAVKASINELGTSAEEHKIQENCSKQVSLWHVSMVLAELKYHKKIIKPTNNTISEQKEKPQNNGKGDINLTLFVMYVFKCLKLTSRKCFTLVTSNIKLKEPDIVIKLKAYGEETTFAIGIFYQKNDVTTFTLNWDYLKEYRKYDKKIDGSSFIVLGTGSNPNKPQAVYILPLNLFKKDTPVRLSSKYKAKNVEGDFRYWPSNGTLTLE